MQVTRVEREQSLYICLLDPCHFFLKRFQPLYLDSGTILFLICQYILSSGIKYVNSKKPLNEAVTTEN